MTEISVKDKEDIIENIKALYANAVNISTNNVSVVIEDGSTIFRIVINLQGSIVSNTNNIIKVLPKVEGPITEAHFVYPQSLKNTARVQAFRNFLFSKIGDWK